MKGGFLKRTKGVNRVGKTDHQRAIHALDIALSLMARAAYHECATCNEKDPRQHQCDRVGILNCGAGLLERETLARRRPARALGRVGALGCAKPVPPSHRA